jgi:predicted nucleic acid-binding protein
MKLVLDASAALAWFVQRSDRREATLADQILTSVERDEALVPALWFTEVSNGLLVAERMRRSDSREATRFLSELAAMPIVEESVRPRFVQVDVLGLARRYELTAYDATYLELALRTRRTLATFDRQLAEATRKAGGQVFGDRP